jgi:hypothetical protein
MKTQTFFNLGLLTGDLWSVGFAVVLEGIDPNLMFYCAFVLIVSGVIMYELAPSPSHSDAHHGQSIRQASDGDYSDDNHAASDRNDETELTSSNLR